MLLLKVAGTLGVGGIFVGLLLLGLANLVLDSMFWLVSAFYDGLTYGAALGLVYLLYRLLTAGNASKDEQLAGLRAENARLRQEMRQPALERTRG